MSPTVRTIVFIYSTTRWTVDVSSYKVRSPRNGHPRYGSYADWTAPLLGDGSDCTDDRQLVYSYVTLRHGFVEPLNDD